MELMKTDSFTEVLYMPYTIFMSLLKWKTKLEEDRQKQMEERIKATKSNRRVAETKRRTK